MRSPWCSITCGLVMGCGAPASEPPARDLPMPATTAPVKPAERPAPPITTAAPPAQTPRFQLAAIRDDELRIAEVGGEVMVAAGALLLRPNAEGTLERVPNATRGLVDPGGMYLAHWRLLAIGGRWPDPVWLHTGTEYQRTTSPPYMYYRKGDRWQRKATRVGTVMHWYYAAFAPWTGEQTLALRLLQSDASLDQSTGEPPSPALQRKIDAERTADPPRLDVLAPATAPVPAPMHLAPGARPVTFTAVPTGEVFVLLEFVTGAGEEAVTSYAVQRFAAEAAEGELDKLEDLGEELDLSLGILTARTADAVYLVGSRGNTGLLARFDGHRWSRLPTPRDNGVTTIAVGTDGVLYAVALATAANEDPDDGLWKWSGEGTWTEVPLPQVRAPSEARWIFSAEQPGWTRLVPRPEGEPLATVSLTEVIARGPDELWLAGTIEVGVGQDRRTSHVVLSPRPGTQPRVIPDDQTLRMEVIEDAPVEPWTPGEDSYCPDLTDPWLRITTLPADAPEDAGTSVVEAVLAAVPEAARRSFSMIREAELGGRRVVGLHARPTRADLQPLLAALAPLPRRAAPLRVSRPAADPPTTHILMFQSIVHTSRRRFSAPQPAVADTPPR